MILKPTNKTSQSNPDAGVIPLINVVFLLLVFFMVAGQIQISDPVELEPARSQEPQVQEHPPLATLFIDQQGLLFLEQSPISLEQLTSELSGLYQASEAAEQSWLQIKTDARTQVQQLRPVFQAIRESGMTQIHLGVQQGKIDEDR